MRPDLTPPRLTSLAAKERLLGQAGIDRLVTLPPTPQVLGLTAAEFWEVLRDGVRPARIVEGQSFNFGRDRGGTIETLIEWAAGTGIVVERRPAHAVTVGEATVVVSSSVIRSLLLEGRVEDAARCLGRPYALEGVVVQGFQRGRTIGVPTANLDVSDGRDVRGRPRRRRLRRPRRRRRPSLRRGPQRRQHAHVRAASGAQIEAHLVDFTGDLYGRRLSVDLVRRLRDQAKYPSVDALKTQLSVRHSGGAAICIG